MIGIGYFGDGPWARETFKRLVSDTSIRICFVTPRYDHPDEELLQLAKVYDIPVELCSNVNSDDYINRITIYNADLFVSMSFDQIFKPSTFNLPPMKTINCHAGKLPFYRGRNILNWALINDEKDFGITVHYVDEGIDTGDIILQRTYPISDDDDYSTLLKRAYPGCGEILYDAIKLIQSGKVEPIRQDSIDPVGLYCGVRKEGDEIIDWNSTSRDIFNFVRAVCRPGPMACSYLNDREIRINKIEEVVGARPYINIPGQILGKTNGGFYVKTRDTFVEIIDFEYDGRIEVGSRMRSMREI